MNFLLLSDLHLEYEPLDVNAPSNTDAVILAGDIGEGADGILWAQASFPDLPVIYVPGNHEFYGGEVGVVARAMREAAAGSNVLLLEKASTVMSGIRVLGTTLWTDFALFAGDDQEDLAWSMSDCRRSVPDFDGRIQCFADGYSVALTPDITRRWHQQSVAWLAEQLATPFAGKTIVVTHHAPSGRSVPAMYAEHPATPAWASQLDDLVALSDFWVHGHVHEACDYTIGPCRIMSNPRGYDGESKTFDAAWLFKV